MIFRGIRLKFLRNKAHAALFASLYGLFFCLIAGCASGPEISIDDLLKDLKPIPANVSGSDAGVAADSPDAPLGGIPDASGSGDQGDGARGNITIQPDCLVQIAVKEDKSLDGNYPVNEIGAVDLNYIGPVILFNKTEKEAEAKIGEILLGRGFKNANIQVRIIRASYDKILVVGAVNKPGELKIGAGDAITLNDALRRAGGLRTSVRGAKVRIVRGGLMTPFPTVLEGEEYTLEDNTGTPSIPDVRLKNNDVANVFSSQTTAGADAGAEKEIYILGDGAGKQGVVRFGANEPCTVMHLIFKIGGLSQYANKKAIKIMRKREDGISAEEIMVNIEPILKEGKTEDDVLLENGDRVIIGARKMTLF
jgi:protein involved in polysaccharide export with SLBB domain